MIPQFVLLYADRPRLLTRRSGKQAHVYSAAVQITFIHPAEMLTEVQLSMSTSCEPGSRAIHAISDVDKPFLFSDLAPKSAKSENKNGFSTSEKARPVNKFD